LEPKILVIDDDPETVDLITLILERHGYKVVVGYHGLQGLALAPMEIPDLIVADIKMPHIDGIEMIRRMRRREPTCQTPILALTGFQREHSIEAIAAGADGVLTKPFTDDVLLASVKTLLANAPHSP